jgi:hypothetical protein
MSSPAFDFALRQVENLPAIERLEVVYMLCDSLPEDVDESEMSSFVFAEYQLRRRAVAANPALKYPRKPQGEFAST